MRDVIIRKYRALKKGCGVDHALFFYNKLGRETQNTYLHTVKDLIPARLQGGAIFYGRGNGKS